jgi:hypothetical protein
MSSHWCIPLDNFVGLSSWIRPIALHEPSEAELDTLKNSADTTIAKPTVAGDEAKDKDPNHPLVEVTILCFVPKAWAAHFLDQCSPHVAYQRYKSLIATIPAGLREDFRYMEAWLKAACLQTAGTEESLMIAKWQAPVIDRKVNTWMERHTQYVNAVPFGDLTPTTRASAVSLDPQMCFDKAMDTIVALKPTPKAKKYSSSELQRLRAACSLSVAEMANGLPELYKMLLIEGRSKRGTESVLANALRPTADNDNPGLI